MGWADNYIKQLAAGETVQFRPSGHSMTGKVNHRDLVTVAPVTQETIIETGDVVLCKVYGKQFLHLVKEKTTSHAELFLIGNNKGRVNGWVPRKFIYGKMIDRQ